MSSPLASSMLGIEPRRRGLSLLAASGSRSPSPLSALQGGSSTLVKMQAAVRTVLSQSRASSPLNSKSNDVSFGSSLDVGPGRFGDRSASVSPVQRLRSGASSPLNALASVDRTPVLSLPALVRMAQAHHKEQQQAQFSEGGWQETELTPEEKRGLYRWFPTVSTNFLEGEQQLLVAQRFKSAAPSHTLTGILGARSFEQVLRVWNVPENVARAIYTGFRRDHKDGISFHEYATALSVLIRGSMERKLEFVYELWDSDKDGALSRSDLRDMLQAVNTSVAPEDDFEETAQLLADKLKADINGVSMSEFRNGVMRIPQLNLLFRSFFGDV